MTVELCLYVSAATEMDAECELLGQLLAGLPRSVRWTIKRTPSAGQPGNPDLDALAAATCYLMLLGADLVAPMGVEWEAAGAANVTRFAYRRSDRMASPAAASFVRSSGVTWQNYATPGEFVAHFELALIRELVNGTPGYGLDLKAIEELAERLQEREAHGHGPRDREASGGSQEAQEWQEDETRRGAGHGGVILPSA